jgi:hypothetical protein
MKTVGRILIILLAAAIVIGGAYALGQTSAGQTLVGQSMGEGGESGDRLTPPDFANGQGAPLGEMRGGREGNGGSWTTVARNLIVVTLIVAAVQVVWSIGRRLRKKSSPSPITVNE